MTANLARYIPGKVWQVAGLAVLARREGVGPVTSTAAAVLGQGTALAGAMLVGAGALLSAADPLRSWGWGALVLLGLGLAVASVPGVLDRAAALWFRMTRTQAPEEGLGSGATFAVRWVGLYVVNWIVYAGAFWLLAMSFDVMGTFLQVGAAFAAAYVLGYLAVFAPAGIGIRESFLVAFLAPVVGTGPAGGLAVVSRLWTTAVEVVAALSTSGVALSDGSGREGEAA